MSESCEIQCPWCHDRVLLVVEPEDPPRRRTPCPLCGQALVVEVRRDSWGDPEVRVDRAD